MTSALIALTLEADSKKMEETNAELMNDAEQPRFPGLRVFSMLRSFGAAFYTCEPSPHTGKCSWNCFPAFCA